PQAVWTVSSCCGQVAPELNAIGVSQPGDLQRERIDFVVGLIAEQIVRKGLENAAENEEEAEIQPLFVAFDTGERRHAHMCARCDLTEREITARAGFADP